MQRKAALIQRVSQQSSNISLKTTVVSQSGHSLNLCLPCEVDDLASMIRFYDFIVETMRLRYMVTGRH